MVGLWLRLWDLGWGWPVFPRPCGAGLGLAGLTLLWPVAVCAGGPLRAGGKGAVSGSSGPVTGALARGGVVLPLGVWWSPSLPVLRDASVSHPELQGLQ